MPTTKYEPLKPIVFLDTNTGEVYEHTAQQVILTKADEDNKPTFTPSGRKITAPSSARFPSKIEFEPKPDQSLAAMGPYDATIETKKYKIIATGRFIENMLFDVQSISVRDRN